MNAETTILIALACVACLFVIKKIRKKRNQKPKVKDSYDDFHLGEMTHYDLPAGYIKRDVDVKWNGRRAYPEPQVKTIKKENIKKENSNGKENK